MQAAEAASGLREQLRRSREATEAAQADVEEARHVAVAADEDSQRKAAELDEARRQLWRAAEAMPQLQT